MPIFQRKIPPLWYVLYPSPSPSSSRPPTREGPFTRSTIAQLLAAGRLGNGALVWTNERIFPNAEKPLSSRPVRIPEWRRLDQLPDPVVRQLEAEARSYTAATAATAAAAASTVQADDPPPDPLTAEQMAKVQQHDRPTHPPAGGIVQAAPSPYPVGAFTAVHGDHVTPPGYPAGTSVQDHAPPHQQTPPTSPGASGNLPGVYPQPSAYPQPGIYPTGSGHGAPP